MKMFSVSVVFSSGLPGNKPPHGTYCGDVNLFGKIEHSNETFQGFLALMVMITKAHAQLVCDRPFLHSPHDDIDFFFLEERRELQGV